MCLWCCWKDLDEQDFNGIYLIRFGFRMWEILILKRFSVAENSNKFQKTRFWKEKSVEGRGNTWAKGTGHISMNYFKNLIPVPASRLCMNFLEKIQHKHKARITILKQEEEEDTIPGPAGMLKK
jgi:hypothetical protein